MHPTATVHEDHNLHYTRLHLHVHVQAGGMCCCSIAVPREAQAIQEVATVEENAQPLWQTCGQGSGHFPASPLGTTAIVSRCKEKKLTRGKLVSAF